VVGSSGVPWFEAHLRAARRALDGGDPRPALGLLAQTRSHPELRAHHVDELTRRPHLRGSPLPVLHAHAERHPDDPDGLLLLGAALGEAAWEARGADLIKRTSAEQVRGMLHYAGLARQALGRAAALLPSDPVPWCQLLTCAMAASAHPGEGDAVWAEIVARGGGDLFGANCTRLTSLTRKWHGSQRECSDFARRRTRDLPPGHPLLALVPLAHVEALLDLVLKPGQRYVQIWRMMRLLRGSRAELDAASQRLLDGTDDYLHHPGTRAAHHAFACAYHESGIHDRARPHLLRSGEGSAGWPWGYFGGDEEFARARLAAGLSAS
jgi:hypothetical protein